MRYAQFTDASAGFRIESEPGDSLPLLDAGEVWTPDRWTIEWHEHPAWELYLQAKGTSVWEVGEGTFSLPAGGAYLIRGGERHRLRHFLGGDVHFYWAVFPSAEVPVEVHRADCWNEPFTALPLARALTGPFQALVQELAMLEPWHAAMCRWYLAALCTAFARASQAPSPVRALARHPAAERAQRLLESRLEHPWRLQELARLSGISAPHLVAVFRREYGETPLRTLRRLRLEEASRQLRTTRKRITDVALDLGFASSQHLARACREHFGATPTQLRHR